MIQFFEFFYRQTKKLSYESQPTLSAVIPVFNSVWDHLEDQIDKMEDQLKEAAAAEKLRKAAARRGNLSQNVSNETNLFCETVIDAAQE
ncbi:hypothetical protein HDU96_010957, partial [Phlyctochytrium bullatum]